MVKNLKRGIVSVILPTILLVGTPVFAQDLTLSDLGIEQPGILPSNPFYFFKSFSRSIRQTLTFSDISRAELQLDILNEQAAELKKLIEIGADKPENFERAILNYIDSAIQLRNRLVFVKPSASNTKFLDLFLDRALKHKEILDGLLGLFKDRESYKDLYNSILKAEDRLIDAVAFVPGNIEEPKKFRDRFQAAVIKQRGDLREFIASEFIDQLESKIKREARDELLKLKDSLLLKWAGRLRAIKSSAVPFGETISAAETETLRALNNFPGDAMRRLKVLDEAREKIADISIKSNINIVRQKILDTIREDGSATKEMVEALIVEVDALIVDAKSRLSSVASESRVAVSAMLERAKFNLDAAKNFYEDEAYGSAFSSALAASAAAKNALSNLVIKTSDYGDELQSIKQYFDALVAKARDNGLDEKQNTKIFAFIKNAESQIVKTADLISVSSESPKALAAIRELKATLTYIDQFIEEAIKLNSASNLGL